MKYYSFSFNNTKEKKTRFYTFFPMTRQTNQNGRNRDYSDGIDSNVRLTQILNDFNLMVDSTK